MTPVQVKINADVKADATPVIQAASEVVSSSNKGFGKIVNAFVGPWVAGRERAIALVRAQTTQDCRLIEAGKLSYREGKLLPGPSLSDDAFVALHELNHQGDAKRLEEAILEAVRQISGVPDNLISDEPISQTFFNRWRREAETIDEEGLRQFWANLLVEETKQPGSISPRTLDVARNLSQKEARLFEQVAKYTCNNALFVDGKGAPPIGQYNDTLVLINAGLLGSQSSKREFPIHKEDSEGKTYADILFANDRFFIRCFDDTVRISCHVLTNEGFELTKILNVCRSQEDIVTIAKTIVDQKPHRLVSVYKIEHIEMVNEGEFRYQYQNVPVWTTKNADNTNENSPT